METAGVPTRKLCGSSSGKWCVSVCVCVTVILDRKRLRCGLGIRCVSIRTVIKKHSTQSTKSRGRSRRPSKRGGINRSLHRAKLPWWHLQWLAAIRPSVQQPSYWAEIMGALGKISWDQVREPPQWWEQKTIITTENDPLALALWDMTQDQQDNKTKFSHAKLLLKTENIWHFYCFTHNSN